MTPGAAPLVYNLFPNLAGKIQDWHRHIPRIQKMGFNTIYVNPLHYPGYSGSLYAVRDYYRYNPLFFRDPEQTSAEQELRSFLQACQDQGIGVWMDLVINHTSFDSPLQKEHPDWYVTDDSGQPVHPGAWDDGEWVEWGDLIELDYSERPARAEMVDYFKQLIVHSLDLGFTGFRCDAAYQIPHSVWVELIEAARGKEPGAIFFAESLGCPPEDTITLANAGFDYVSSSARWWDFKQSWAPEQYEQIRPHAPSISFPENHDTERLVVEKSGNLLEALQVTRFTAFLTEGWMITMGFEWTYTRRCHVVESRAEWAEPVMADVSELITRLLQVKKQYSALREEGPMHILDRPGTSTEENGSADHTKTDAGAGSPGDAETIEKHDHTNTHVHTNTIEENVTDSTDHLSQNRQESSAKSEPQTSSVFAWTKSDAAEKNRLLLLMNFDTAKPVIYTLPSSVAMRPGEEILLDAPFPGPPPTHVTTDSETSSGGAWSIHLPPGGIRIFHLPAEPAK